MIFGGGGFFHIELDTDGMRMLEASFEFGATAALDIGVASGEVHIMAGIYFSLQRKEGSTELAPILTGYLRLGGSLNVLGLIRVSVEFNLSFVLLGQGNIPWMVHALIRKAEPSTERQPRVMVG